MARKTLEIPELRDVGNNIASARAARRLTQVVLAKRCAMSQGMISSIEAGNRRPTIDLLFRVARALDVPVLRLISGSDRPGGELRDIAVQLRNMGVVDLWVQDAVVPCAFQQPEEVIVLAVQGHAPDPRIITALPAVLAWNAWDRRQLKAFCRKAEPRGRVVYRLAWLADIALAIHRRRGFPGGCRTNQLTDFVRSVGRPEGKDWDNLGGPTGNEPRSRIWRRWMIKYDANLNEFEERAIVLAELRQSVRKRPTRAAGGEHAE